MKLFLCRGSSSHKQVQSWSLQHLQVSSNFARCCFFSQGTLSWYHHPTYYFRNLLVSNFNSPCTWNYYLCIFLFQVLAHVEPRLALQRKYQKSFTLSEHQQQITSSQQVFEIVGTSSLETLCGNSKVSAGRSFGSELPESPHSLPLRSPSLQQHWHWDSGKVVHAQLKMDASNLGWMKCTCSFRRSVKSRRCVNNWLIDTHPIQCKL